MDKSDAQDSSGLILASDKWPEGSSIASADGLIFLQRHGQDGVNTEDRDDVAQLLVALQRLLDSPRAAVVFFADDVRVDLPRRRVQRVDRRIDAQRRDVARQY